MVCGSPKPHCSTATRSGSARRKSDFWQNEGIAMRRPSGNLIIAGQNFKIDAPVINFREPPFWDATREVCQPTATDPSPPCKPGGVPYGNLPKPYTKRYSLRPMLRRYGMNPPLEAVKSAIKQFVIHH